MGRNPCGNCMKMIKLDSCRMGEVWLDEYGVNSGKLMRFTILVEYVLGARL